jgi:hypothetical protein
VLITAYLCDAFDESSSRPAGRVRLPHDLKHRTTIAVAIAVALVSGGALAAGGEQVRLNAADQAAARAVVIRRADLGSSSGWTGGMRKPNLGATPTCSNFHPKQSDLVLTGAAEADFVNSAGLEFDSEAQVLKTTRMVALDWQRTVLAPTAIPCIRQHLVAGIGSGRNVVSFTRISLPHLGTSSAAFRVVIDVKNGNTVTKVMLEPILVAKGRTEITLTAIAPLATEAVISAAAVRLARIMAARAPS